MSAETVYIVAGKRRRLHRATRVGSMIQTLKGCNLDQTDAWKWTALTLGESTHFAAGGRDRLCWRCFP